jgi:tripartite-type tricarboxylate transporter receptor subunit TctC
MPRKTGWIAIALSLACALPAGTAQAQGYPERPIRMIVPFPPGGSVDVVGRALTPKLSGSSASRWSSRTAAARSGTIGTEAVARARPTVHRAVNTIPFVTNSYLYKRVPYDAFTDFLPVSWLCSSPGTLVVNPSVPARSVRELRNWRKPSPARSTTRRRARAPTPLRGELFNYLEASASSPSSTRAGASDCALRAGAAKSGSRFEHLGRQSRMPKPEGW